MYKFADGSVIDCTLSVGSVIFELASKVSGSKIYRWNWNCVCIMLQATEIVIF